MVEHQKKKKKIKKVDLNDALTFGKNFVRSKLAGETKKPNTNTLRFHTYDQCRGTHT